MDAKKCPNCSQLYHLQSVSPQLQGNIPLLLKCGHSMCEKCLTNIIKFMEPIQCHICKHDMEVSASDVTLVTQNKIQLYQLFPVNVFMLGEMVLDLSRSSVSKDNENDAFYIDVQSIIKGVDNTQGQCMECHNLTSKMCQQCATALCETCFNKTHKTFIIFKSHTLKNIEPSMGPNTCKIHKDKPLDYYCKDCEKPICLDCMMVGGEKSCKLHNVVSMQEVNEIFIEELNGIVPKVDEVFRRLTKTAVDVGNIQYNLQNNTGSVSEVEQILLVVEQHFSKLFSTIQKHKNEVTKIITKLKCSEKESLKTAQSDIECSLKKTKQILSKINVCLDPKYTSQINLSSLLEDAKGVVESPWYLSRDESTDDPLKVTVNEDLCTLMNDYIHLEGNAKSVYKLRSTSELGDMEIPRAPPNVVFPPELPKDVRQTKQQMERVSKEKPKVPMLVKQVPRYHSKSGSTTSLNSLNSDNAQFDQNKEFKRGNYNQSPVVQPVLPFPENHHPKQLHEGSLELIYITHIVDPHNFFVQRACHQELVKEMVREFRNATGLPKPSITHIAEGKNYLVFNKVDNMWQRCRVISIDRRNLNNPVVSVFCIDFGSTELVGIDNLRLLPPARVQSPFPLAINCKLANCEPKNGSWSSDDSYLIQNIIDNKQAVIHVRHIRSTGNYAVVLECDLTTFDVGVSVAHALVFHNRAVMPYPKLQYPKVMTTYEKPRIFMNNSHFKSKSTEIVKITYLVNPDKFYVRKAHDESVYEKMCDNLENEYVGSSGGNVYLPEIGMFYAVNCEKYLTEEDLEKGSWARCYVVEKPGGGRVRVLLLDTGHTLLVHWSKLRRLQHKLSTVRALVTECHLAGITPLNKKWSTGSLALMQKYMDRNLDLYVDDFKGSVGVTLYDKNDEDNVICINQEMIKHRFAISFGLFNFNTKDTEERVYTKKSPLDEPKPRQKPKTERIQILKNPKDQKAIQALDLKAKNKGPFRLEAKVLQYHSPSLFYIAISHQVKNHTVMYEKMQEYYTKKKAAVKSDWKAGDRCCAMCKQSETWRRANVMEIDEANAKIFYTDFAFVETVPVGDLRILAPEFEVLGDAALRCHLYGIMPAGSDQWPSLTKELLKELLDAYNRVFVTKRGEFVDNSMPVELWVYHTIQGGALEANKSEWRCLNKNIVDQGLAIPDKTQELSTAENDNPGDDSLAFLNLGGTIKDWLLLENDAFTIAPPKDSNNADESDCSSTIQAESCDHMSQANSSTMFVSDWLKPEPISSQEFTGVPTYIDNYGVIYLHEVSQRDTLDLIRKALDVRFVSPDPRSKYIKWSVGEPCIALFFLDNRFYRGKIMEVNTENSTCLIHYVDYGNEEWCSFENLRKSIALHQIPVQAHKCVLNRIKPVDEQWSRQTLDYIHKFIVEKECFIKITGKSINDITPIDLKYDKLWINDHLVEFELAAYTDGSKSVLKKFAPQIIQVEARQDESSSEPDYIISEDEHNSTLSSIDVQSMEGKDWNELLEEQEKETDPVKYYKRHDFDEFSCNITTINDPTILVLNLVLEEEQLYDNMIEELQKEVQNLSPINGIYEHKACVALFPEDNQWYRASILQYNETKGKAKVRYVDYGNVEVVSLADIKEITNEWMVLPPQCLAAKIYGIEIKPDVDNKEITKVYSDIFLGKGPFLGKIVKYENRTPLVELRNKADELIYQEIINKGIFIKCDPEED